ncbi:uncharacterized protein C8A04DRAFT_14312 [Dichotomopilus funicola]|uniref:Uncharacterized protein n=1 Tax=Dichotomopilus funicola TaxID=1934379 RepID=A0AAN6ZJX7_9PEZI|nr:hypothetical protein C8A04DRAFT_14312 [Dichotomopilus funicola]
MSFPLAGKTAIVTGGAGGIGFAVASRFAREGASVVLVGRSQRNLETASEKLKSSIPTTGITPIQQHAHFRMSVDKPQDWERLAAKYPKTHYLINCAGETQRSLLFQLSEEGINEQLSINLSGAIYGARYDEDKGVSPSSACIINISSLLAYRADKGTSVYAAAKSGLHGLTTSLAHELSRHRIRVNTVVPGYILTNMTKDIEKQSELAERIPVGRFGTPDEVADAVAFLVKNEYANNCMLNLDGGLSAV